MTFFAKCLLSLALLLGAAAGVVRGGNVTIADPGFDVVGGVIQGIVDLNVLDSPPDMLMKRLGLSPWYGRAEVTTAGNIGLRGGIEADYSAASAGSGLLTYNVLSLGALVGLDLPTSYLWQPLSGTKLEANTTYTLSLDVTTSSVLSLSLLSNNGFGFGITTGASASGIGSFYAQTTTAAPDQLTLSLQGGNTNRLSYSFTTGSTAPTGDLGVVIYAGYGTQALSLDLIPSYRVDNVSLFTSVPEPSSAALLSLFAGGMLGGRRFRHPIRPGSSPS